MQKRMRRTSNPVSVVHGVTEQAVKGKRGMEAYAASNDDRYGEIVEEQLSVESNGGAMRHRSSSFTNN
jgi:hypothetical protein